MKISFRALFAGPKGTLNPSGWNAPKPSAINIEVFSRGNNWHVQVIGADGYPTAELTRLGKHPTHGAAKDSVAEVFQTQLGQWQMWESIGKNERGIPIDPDFVEETPDGKFTRRVVTHVAAQQQYDVPGQPNKFRTHCGTVVDVHQIRSRRGEQSPLCLECRANWEEHRKEPRI